MADPEDPIPPEDEPEELKNRRTELQDLLEEQVGAGVHVYFQPPSSLSMEYPCLVLRRDYIDQLFADNAPYRCETRYSLMVITKDPDSTLPDLISSLPKTSYVRNFILGNLYHDVFTIYH